MTRNISTPKQFKPRGVWGRGYNVWWKEREKQAPTIRVIRSKEMKKNHDAKDSNKHIGCLITNSNFTLWSKDTHIHTYIY